MAGIYGDLLMFFPEMFQTVPYYEKQPEVGAGFKTTASGTTDVIIMTEKNFTAALGKNTSSFSNDILSIQDKEYIWAPDDTPLHVGSFILDDDKLCTITGRASWAQYGGFIRFEFEITQGAQGEDRPKASLIKGKF